MDSGDIAVDDSFDRPIGPTRWTKKNTPLMLEFIVLLDRCIIFAVFVYSCIFIKRRCSLSTDVN